MTLHIRFFSLDTFKYFPGASLATQRSPGKNPDMSNDINVKFLGHSAFSIQYSEWNLLIDPFITGNPAAEEASVDAEELNPTHIILTHGHGDHLGDTVNIAERTGCEVITTFECANYLKEKGLEKVADLGIGGGRNFPFGRVKFTIAHHSSSAPDGTYMGNPAGVLIRIGGKLIYHAGDTALTYEMKLLGEMNEIDLALLPIGDNYTMDARDAVKAVEFIDPDVAIPMHYDTFPVVEADPEVFRKGVEEQGKKCVILEPGESFSMEAE